MATVAPEPLVGPSAPGAPQQPAAAFPVICPPNAGPGTQLLVQVPTTGQQMTVVVPAGIGPGLQFLVALPQAVVPTPINAPCGTRFCTACGKPLDAGSNFCAACGAAAGSQQEEVPQVAPAAAQTQVAPAAAQMNRGVPIAGREGPLRLTLTSHPGQALRTDGDCCIPFPPPVFVCCCSGVLLGDENSAMKVVYNPARGQLLRPDACYQRIHNEDEKFVPDNEVISFRCGLLDCDQSESWTLYSDGTIHSKYHPELVLGARDKDGKLILVRQEDRRRQLVFKEVLAMEKIPGRINVRG